MQPAIARQFCQIDLLSPQRIDGLGWVVEFNTFADILKSSVLFCIRAG
jgi:hypothetical protein